MQSNHDYIFSYLKRCICCWYWVRVLVCRTLPSYKMFDLALLQNVWPCPPTKCMEQTYVHRVTFSTVKSARPHDRIQRWHFSKFRFGLGNGILKKSFMCSRSEYLLSLLHVPYEQCLVAAWDFFFSPTKFCFSLDSALSAIEICSSDWHCLYYILKPNLRDNYGNLFLALSVTVDLCYSEIAKAFGI
jgi:hypothetical protein